MGRLGRNAALWIAAIGFALNSIALWVGPFAAVPAGAAIFAPLVALFGFELGFRAGIAAALAALGLFVAALYWDGQTVASAWIVAQAVSLLALGVGGGLLGVRIRRREKAAATSTGLQPSRTMYVKPLKGDRLLYADPQIEELTGYSPAMWLGGDILKRILHPEDRERVLAELGDAQRDGAPLSIVYRMRRRDGATVWVRDASDVIDEGGRRRRRGFLYDITARREAELSHERQARLALGLIEGALDGMCLTDREGHILMANSKMRGMAQELGLPAEEELTGKHLRELGERFLDPADLATIERIVGEQPDERLEHEFDLPDGGRSFQGYVSPVETAGGEYLGRIWTLHETTSERTVDRLRHDFTTSVSHELRTPLTSILGYLELLEESLGELEKKPSHYLEVIMRNSRRLLHLVNDLLSVAQIQAGSFEIERTALDPTDLAKAALDSARLTAARKRIELSFERGRPHEILGDPVRLGQAFDNLIANAIKFTPEGGRVTVRVEVVGQDSTITVEDNGIGIPKAEQAQLFERFFRSSSASARVIPGTGLGLTIVGAIVEAHGGSIGVESDTGKGTTVRIAVPLAEVSAGAEGRAEHTQP